MLILQSQISLGAGQQLLSQSCGRLLHLPQEPYATRGEPHEEGKHESEDLDDSAQARRPFHAE